MTKKNTDRRAPDPRIDEIHTKQTENMAKIANIDSQVSHLHECVEAVKKELEKNTEVTQQVADILTSFKVTMWIAKWVGIVSGAIAATWTMVKGFRQ